MRRLFAALLLGIVGACFDAPDGAVMFSCDPDEAPACPSGYTCESDGCCHKNGSDVDANLGACKLAPSTEATTVLTASTTDASSSDTGSTASSDTGSESSDTGGSSSSESSSGSSGSGSSETGSSSSEGGGSSSSSG
ncbi:MAG TPA: hypothetical protein VG755_06800 [Nannocystaceae bacterium]|nr:hypothetical protein [Nannocystaceae bacterium]